MKRPVRVLSVIDGLGFGGAETRLLIMGRMLDPSVCKHSVLTLNPAGYTKADEYQARRQQFLDTGIQVDNLAEIGRTRNCPWAASAVKVWPKTGILRRSRELARIAKAWNVDVIDSHLDAAGLVAALAGRMAKIPTSLTLYCGNRHGDSMIWPKSVRLSLKLVNAVLTDSRERGRELQSLVSNGRTKISVVPNGVPRPCSSRTPAEMRLFLGLPVDPSVRVIGQVARLIDYKGQMVLLRAARKILDRSPHCAFLLVGAARSDEYKTSLVRLVEELGIANRVVITESRGNIGDIWNAIDVHAHPSLFDSLPIAIAEGMSLAKPAVVTNVGGIPEMVISETTGLVVSPGDLNQLADAILRLVSDANLAKTLGQAARERYEKLYRPEVMAQSMQRYFLALARQ